MKQKFLTKFSLAILLLGSSATASVQAQEASTIPTDSLQLIFKFVPSKDMFYLKGNELELQRLFSLVDTHMPQIQDGTAPFFVDGYCVSTRSKRHNRHIAHMRASRVKSELITNKGLKEEHFTTRNLVEPYNDEQEVVVVRLQLPEPVQEQVAQPQEQPQKQEIVAEQPQVQAQPEVKEAPVVQAAPHKRPKFDLRTNLLMWAMLTPNLGLEWHATPSLGIKIDGGYNGWEFDDNNKILKSWYVNPEVRWYMLDKKQFYVGVGASIGDYNIKLSKTGYQGDVYGGGITVGYQLPMGKHFSWDFNLGLGYLKFNYDTFYVESNKRLYKAKDCSKNWFGPTQLGINLVWHIGR
ncbi:MAG: DUF3575 domain-containing protein [Alistipes sp.]